ncbi:hypothetical protein JHK84_038803 [Glycine max]|nr:hypothetical protein JHK86_038584 [Glycine max]KAG5120463.1 hypothetical protein JHK84_038803 [Glycine max]
MNLLCVALLTLILLHGASRGHDDVVKIGAIFTLKTINGRVSKIAIQAAEKDVNSDPRILGGRKLSITIHDSNFSGFLGFIGVGPSNRCSSRSARIQTFLHFVDEKEDVSPKLKRKLDYISSNRLRSISKRVQEDISQEAP